MRAAIVSTSDNASSATLHLRLMAPGARPKLRLYAWFAAALFVLAFGSILLAVARLQPLAHHMSTHILLMNVIAPFVAHGLTAQRGLVADWFSTGRSLAAATMTQLATLWAVHIPVVFGTAIAAPGGEYVVQALLLTTATWFWLSALSQRGASRWRALLALLLTGKLFCLLAALLVFAPRLLYPEAPHVHHSAVQGTPLADQQLAGLLMISACPLTYVLEAIIITAIWLKELEGNTPPAEQAG
jgi:putative membrane protein